MTDEEKLRLSVIRAQRRKRDKLRHGGWLRRRFSRRRLYGGTAFGDLCIFVFLLLLAVFMLMPIFITVCESIKPVDELYSYPPKLLPVHPTLENFASLRASVSNLWGFTLVPGSQKPDGTISHAANGSATAAIIFSSAKNKSAAWEYIKWFTGAPVQVRFGRDVEAQSDDVKRYNTANKVALSQMSWGTSDYMKITQQIRQLQNIPIIPATYATTRYLRSAFREVVHGHSHPRETLLNCIKDINTEIARKNAQLASA
ncbi:hypothetical protein FACS1894120_6950 [Clostridia bacterium]|nr:hypothetical protein FACS1894120_6950 [Clostridia bacterium]